MSLRVYAHRNLNRKCWSVLDRGLLKEYQPQMNLADVEFRVRPGGQARAIREGKRNVHAFAVGRHVRNKPPGKPVQVRYNLPKGVFTTMRGRTVGFARFAHLDTSGKVWVWE